jgi:hypothetical protein
VEICSTLGGGEWFLAFSLGRGVIGVGVEMIDYKAFGDGGRCVAQRDESKYSIGEGFAEGFGEGYVVS